MKMIRITMRLFLLFSGLLVMGQNSPKQQRAASSFAIDPTKPFVYLELDHVGPRRPRGKDEPGIGMFFRLKNNSNLPIIVSTAGGPPGSADCDVMDEVVGNRTTGIGMTGGTITDSLASAKTVESEEEPPIGYIFDIRTATHVPPGGDISFSLPINHVGRKWHFQVPFSFDLPRTHQRQPETYLTFFYDDLPPRDRPSQSPMK